MASRLSVLINARSHPDCRATRCVVKSERWIGVARRQVTAAVLQNHKERASMTEKSNISRSLLNRRSMLLGTAAAAGTATNMTVATHGLLAQAQTTPSPAGTPRPNIIAIMADDIGWFNIGAYNQGMMA